MREFLGESLMIFLGLAFVGVPLALVLVVEINFAVKYLGF